jgi:formylglycine-generating enzyme required for sulfatase activity
VNVRHSTVAGPASGARLQRLSFLLRGLFDLHGNLFEWTHDWYGDFGETAAVDSLGPKGGSIRVIRGGGWTYDPALCRSASRRTDDATSRSDFDGFRLALSLSGLTP